MRRKSASKGRIRRAGAETGRVRNAALHHHLETYAIDASGCLCGCTAAGEEIPFELCEEPGSGSAALYCYRPLTDRFVRDHRDRLSALPSHDDAARALSECEALDVYLTAHGEVRIPGDRLGCAELAIESFLRAMFAERSDFGFEPAHFEAAYAELERTVYADHGAATVIAPVLGIALDAGTTELTLGEGVSLIRGDALAGAPREAVWGDAEEPRVLAVLTTTTTTPADRGGAVPLARARFRRVLSALRLFERGTYAVGPLAWARTDAGNWRVVSVGVGGRLGGARRLTIVPIAREEELRAFYRLVGRRGGATATGSGELAWALARFEMGCERPAALEALTDHLLALRALLEPEGPASGRLAARLSVICAQPDGRAALARRIARAAELERAAVTGMLGTDPTDMDRSHPRSPESIDAIVDELAANLAAILRDALCGHLEADLCGLADELLTEAADAAETAEAGAGAVAGA
jgi:hypothetical protein